MKPELSVQLYSVREDAANDYDGASFNVVRNTAFSTDDVFGFDVAGASFTDSGTQLLVGADVIADYVYAAGVLDITFANNGTAVSSVLVNEVLQRITYSNSNSNPPTSVDIDITFDDGLERTIAYNLKN